LSSFENIKIWIRIHPNLKAVRWNFIRRVYKLETLYKNVSVIYPDSNVSTYTLLDSCNTVVSFGSTIGIEASYWGKPSVLIGRSSYENLGSVYVPKSHSEVISLLKDEKLKPLPRDGAEKFGLHWIKGGVSIKYFEGDRNNGFTFNKFNFSKNLIEYVFFAIGKLIEIYILGFINYLFRKNKIS